MDSSKVRQEILSYLPEAFKIKRGHVAGGFIRSIADGTTIADMDIFFVSMQDLAESDRLMQTLRRFNREETSYAVTFTNGGRKIQLIKAIHGNAKQLMDAFDFTVCKACIPLIDGGGLIVNPKFYAHIQSKTLVIDKCCPDPLGSLRRVARYMDYGYSVRSETIKTIHDELQKLMPRSGDYPQETQGPDEWDPFAE